MSPLSVRLPWQEGSKTPRAGWQVLDSAERFQPSLRFPNELVLERHTDSPVEAALKESSGRVFGSIESGRPRSTLKSKIRSLEIDGIADCLRT